MTWSFVGFILLLIAYFLFEFLTPVFSIDKEIESDNRACRIDIHDYFSLAVVCYWREHYLGGPVMKILIRILFAASIVFFAIGVIYVMNT